MSNQKDLLDFVDNPDNLNRAIEGSMEKRQAVIDQANGQTIEQRLDQILERLYISAWVEGSNYDEDELETAETPSDNELRKTARAKQALLQLMNEARIETKEVLYQGGEKRFISMLLEHGVEYTEEFHGKDTLAFRINRKTIDKYRKGELTPQKETTNE